MPSQSPGLRTIIHLVQDVSKIGGIPGRVRNTVAAAQDREGGSWNGRQTGIVAFRIGRADHMDDGVRSLMLGVEQGFGYERGLNATLSASWRLDSIR